jgi:nicotinamide-nucleotide adenylyltransferase
MDYILAGKALCDFLVVGITNPDPTLTAFHPSNPHRSLPSSNPFTFYERMIMTRDSLLESGLLLSEFIIVPMPINKPELIRNYAPADAMFFLTVYDDWGRAKVRTLEGLGLKTKVLWERDLAEKTHSSTEIRWKIATGQPWEVEVPNAVARHIKEMALDVRVAALLKTQTKA